MSHVVIKSQAAFEDLAASTVLYRHTIAVLGSVCSSVASNSRNRRHLGTSPSVWMLGSASCVSVGCSKAEILPSDRVSKACFQTIEMLLKLESSAGSIINMLKSRSLTTPLLLHAGESVLPASIIITLLV